MKNNDSPQFLVRLASIMLIISILCYWLYSLQSVIIPFIITVLLSMLLLPICKMFEKWGIPKVGAISIAIVLLTIVIIGIGFLSVMEMSNFSEMLPQLTKKSEIAFTELQNWAFQKYGISPNKQLIELNKYGETLLKGGSNIAGTALSVTGVMIINLTVMPIYMFFMLYYRTFFKNFFYKVFDNTERDKIDEVLKKICEVMQSYLTGLGLVTIIIGIMNTIGFWLLGIDYAIFLGFLASVLLIFPYIGGIIALIPSVIVALVTKDSPMYAVGVVAMLLFVQLLEGNFIKPKIVGSKISVNPLAAILALFLGAWLWGIGGMALALPITAILKVIFDSVEDLQPYGYLLGEPEHTIEMIKHKEKAKKIEKGIVQTIAKTSKKVASILGIK